MLAIGAHPDDVEIGCGGALAKHRDQGDVLMILTFSHGGRGGHTHVRVREAQEAARRLGATLEMGEFEDAAITDGPASIGFIEAAIRTFKPTHVYTHSREDTHQDHRAVHAATMVAARGVPHLYCYQSPSTTVEFRPQLFIDISAYIHEKLDLIGIHDSQTSKRANIERELIMATARYWGRFAGHVLAAEPMAVVRHCM